MAKQTVKDVLDEMTKEDLVAWIRSHHFSRPKRSEVLYLRWERQSAEVLEEMQKETAPSTEWISKRATGWPCNSISQTTLPKRYGFLI